MTDLPKEIWASTDAPLAKSKSGTWHEYPYGQRYVRADLVPQPVTVSEAAKVLESELGLAGILTAVEGDEAHRIMPAIWPALCKYVKLALNPRALAEEDE